MVLAARFDGTLCKIGTKIAYHENVDYCRFHKKAGWELELITYRQGKALQDALDWCERQGLRFDYIMQPGAGFVYFDKLLGNEQVMSEGENEC